MELTIQSHTVAHPTADDIVRAIAAAPMENGWSITLDPESGYLEAVRRADGGFDLERADQHGHYTSALPVDSEKLTTIFVKFFNHDAGWQRECAWKEEVRSATPLTSTSDKSAPPTWAVAIVVATIGLVTLIFSFGGASEGWLRSHLPYGNSDYFYVGLIFLPILVLVLLMVAVKLLETRRAASWPRASGRIVKSTVTARHQRMSGEATTVKNVPDVAYDFSVGGRPYRGTRIGIGEDAGGANTGATLARYPIGAPVQVYYDPADPTNCVLERDMPEGMGKGCLVLVALLVVCVGGIWYATTNAARLIGDALPNANAGATVFAATFGLAVLLFFFANRRMLKQAEAWPTVRGRVVTSGTEAVASTDSDSRTTTNYTPAVEFAYAVRGIEYRSRQIKTGLTISGSRGYAEKTATRYPQGATVTVHYDPKNPSNASLENPTGMTWIMLAVALACFGIAVFASGVLK